MATVFRYTATLILIMATAGVQAQNQVVTQAKKAGVKRCLATIDAISNFIIGGKEHGAHNVWSQQDPDKGIFSSSIERDVKQGPRLTSITVAPAKDGNCSLVYDQVAWFPQSCMVVAKEYFANFTYKGVLAKKVMLLEGPATVYMLPAGEGCLSMKKQVVINADKVIKRK